MPRIHRLLPLFALLLPLAGCDDGVPSSARERTISGEAFVETVVELRKAAIIRESGVVPDTARERILAAQGVTEEELRHFVEVHGDNVPLMTRIWENVEAYINLATYEEYRSPTSP